MKILGAQPGRTFTITFATAVLGLAMRAQVSTPLRKPSPNKHPRVRIRFSHALPSLNGDHLKVEIVEVTYGPGQFSPPHSHPCPVIGYVLAGSVRMQVKGERAVTYKAGDSFYEAPNGVHLVSANTSQTEPARFLAYFICDHETPLTIPVPGPRVQYRKLEGSR